MEIDTDSTDAEPGWPDGANRAEVAGRRRRRRTSPLEQTIPGGAGQSQGDRRAVDGESATTGGYYPNYGSITGGSTEGPTWSSRRRSGRSAGRPIDRHYILALARSHGA